MRSTIRNPRPGRALAVAADGRDARAASVRPALLKVALVGAGIGVLAASAWISVPFYPVPMTMQTLAVLLVGGLMGPRMGVAAVAGYLALGLAGLPLFHGGIGGAVVLAGPTGGYLMGFVPAAFLMGLAGRWTASRPSGRLSTLWRLSMLVAGALLAEIAIYALGLPWLALVTGLDAGRVVAAGLLPFILGDLVKMAVAAAIVHGGRSVMPGRSLLPF